MNILGTIGTIMLQAQADRFISALERGKEQVTRTVDVITTVAMAVCGVIALISLIMIFTGDGDGSEKVKKAGVWIFTLAFIAIGMYILKLTFGN